MQNFENSGEILLQMLLQKFKLHRNGLFNEITDDINDQISNLCTEQRCLKSGPY